MSDYVLSVIKLLKPELIDIIELFGYTCPILHGGLGAPYLPNGDEKLEVCKPLADCFFPRVLTLKFLVSIA